MKRRGKPYYTSLGKDLHLGYRKNAGGLGKWVVRRYIGDQQYKVETIAVADDILDAAEDISDALRTGTLNFWQAQEQAREIAGKKSYVGPYRVLDAVTAYRKTLEGRGSEYDSGVRFERHILPVLGDEIIDKLTAEKLRDWHRDLSRSMPRIPKKKTGVQHSAGRSQ